MVAGSGVMSYAVHPGLVSTELGRHVHQPDTQKSLGRRIISAFSKSVSQGAQTSVYCALEPNLAHHSGYYYRCVRKFILLLPPFLITFGSVYNQEFAL